MNQPANRLKQLCWKLLLNPAEKKVVLKGRDLNGCGESPSCLRARLKPCRKGSVCNGALAPEVRSSFRKALFPHSVQPPREYLRGQQTFSVHSVALSIALCLLTTATPP